jgi:glycogen(starch) synthase
MVGNGYPPHSVGGYESIWQAAVEHLRAAGHEIEILTTDARRETGEPDAPWVHRQLRWRLRDGRFAPVTPRARLGITRHNHRFLEAHLDRFRPDVVSWWSMGGLSLTMLETVRERGLPGVAFVLDEWLDYGRWADAWLGTFTGPRRSLAAPLAARLSRLPTRVDFGSAATYVFISEFTRQQALGLDLGLERTAVAHSGVHADFLDPAPQKDWNWRLLYSGRIDPRKGIDTAVAALRHLPPEAGLTVAGSWAAHEERRLVELADEMGLSGRVRFQGHLDRAALVRAYGEADALLFPVRWNEPWGLVPLEAMGRGLPVVATGRGGSAEYLRDGENCLLFEADDELALADAVRRLAESRDLRERLRQQGVRTAAGYTEENYNRAVEAALLEAVSPGSVTTPQPELAA